MVVPKNSRLVYESNSLRLCSVLDCPLVDTTPQGIEQSMVAGLQRHSGEIVWVERSYNRSGR